MNQDHIRKACLSLGMAEPISIESDGTVWLGQDDNRTYPDMKPILAEYHRLRIERQRKAAYEQEADPLFFQYQRGDVTEQAWLDAVQSVKDRYPYPA